VTILSSAWAMERRFRARALRGQTGALGWSRHRAGIEQASGRHRAGIGQASGRVSAYGRLRTLGVDWYAVGFA